jgi:hypothetical protein
MTVMPRSGRLRYDVIFDTAINEDTWFVCHATLYSTGSFTLTSRTKSVAFGVGNGFSIPSRGRLC